MPTPKEPTKKDADNKAQADIDAQFKPDHAYYVGIPDVVSDAKLEHMKQNHPSFASIEAVATERNAEWHKAMRGKTQMDPSQVDAAAAAAKVANDGEPETDVAPTGESEVANG